MTCLRPLPICLAGAAALTLVCAPSATAATSDTKAHPARHPMGATVPSRTSAQPGPSPAQTRGPGPGQPGIDVSHYQGDIRWPAVADDGIAFAYIKATEGTTHTDPRFHDNYAGAGQTGLLRGAYHFALPNQSSARAQARFFLTHGGNQADGRTLPPALDIEYNPNGPDCYGLTPRQMIDWIAEFSATVHRHTGRHPVIYTTTDWWNSCTGGHRGFADTNPLWIAHWAPRPTPLPRGWSSATFWQYTNHGQVSGIDGNVDRDRFNGPHPQLQDLAS